MQLTHSKHEPAILTQNDRSTESFRLRIQEVALLIARNNGSLEVGGLLKLHTQFVFVKAFMGTRRDLMLV